MEDLFKKFVNAGVGYIAQGSKSVQTTIEKLVKENKMTQAEGKKIVDELMKTGETKRTELEKQFQSIVERAKSSVGLSDAQPTKGKAAATANNAASKAAGAVKKVADKVSAAAGSAQKSTAAKAATAAKPAAKPAAKATAATKPAAKAAAATKPAAKPATKPAARKPAAPALPTAKAEDNA